MKGRYTPLAVPGPSVAQMGRWALTAVRDPLGFLSRCVDRYGDLVAFPLPAFPVLLVNTPDGAARVLRDAAGRYDKQTVQYRSLGAITGAGLLTSDGDVWREHRAVIQPSFHHTRLPDLGPVAAEVAADLGRRWVSAGVVDAGHEVPVALLDLVRRNLFHDPAVGSGAESSSRGLVDAVEAGLRAVVASARSPLPGRLDPVSARRLRRANAALDAAAATLVADRAAAGAGDGAEDVLGVLLAARDQGVVDDRAVRDELVTMVIAGHETVASALTWALGLLAHHPPVQDALAEELDRVLDAGRPVTWPDLASLTLTRAVLDEALRLYPPAWVITRRAAQDDVISGVAVPVGTLVIISPYLLHRRPDAWPDPERFDPTRFLTSDGGSGRAASARPRPDYLPFGLGPRLCIGRDVALVEGTLLLAGLLHGRRVTPVRSALPRAEALVTMRPRGGLPLRLG